MGGFYAVDELLYDRHGIVKVQRTAKVTALDILHDQIVGTNIVAMADVGVIEKRDRAGVACKTLGKLGLETLIETPG